MHDAQPLGVNARLTLSEFEPDNVTKIENFLDLSYRFSNFIMLFNKRAFYELV